MKKIILAAYVVALSITAASAQSLKSEVQSLKSQEATATTQDSRDEAMRSSLLQTQDSHPINATDGSFFTYPSLRYSVCHMREFLPTKVVPSAEKHRYFFEEEYDPNIPALKVPINSQLSTVNCQLSTLNCPTDSITVAQALDSTHADGFIVLHKGRIVYEYLGGHLSHNGTHAVMSMSKSLTGTLGAMLVAEGVLEEDAYASFYVPELKGSAFEDATIRELLDMTTALQYSEDYSNPHAEVYAFSAAGTPCNPDWPSTYRHYLPTVKKSGEHGLRFAYKTINTDALAWVIEMVTNKSIPDLLSERIWQPMGAHYDGYYQVDGYGVAFAGGGFNGHLHDLAAFGEMMRNYGRFNGKQIIPASITADIIANADNARFDQVDYPLLKGWGYRDMWWVTNNDHKAFCARGVYGQVIYIDPVAEMTIVRLASCPVAANTANDHISQPLYQTIANYFLSEF